jgi:hypothetical protein
MRKAVGLIAVAVFSVVASLEHSSAQGASTSPPTSMPEWLRRGLPGPGHAALEPLVGTWRVHMSLYGTLGRSPNDPPIVTDDLICRRTWVAGGRYIEDTMEGTAEGAPVWRKGWLGYSTMDRRYEWITIDSVNSTMMRYEGAPGSGDQRPISMTGVFTDQGVAGENTVGRAVGMRTVITIESNDRHVIELYFTRPGSSETLATRAVYTRSGQ